MDSARPLPSSPSWPRLALGSVTLRPAMSTPGDSFLMPRTRPTDTVPAVASSTAEGRAAATACSTWGRFLPSVATATCTAGFMFSAARARVASSSISRP